jgi:hypothetical protein
MHLGSETIELAIRRGRLVIVRGSHSAHPLRGGEQPFALDFDRICRSENPEGRMRVELGADAQAMSHPQGEPCYPDPVGYRLAHTKFTMRGQGALRVRDPLKDGRGIRWTVREPEDHTGYIGAILPSDDDQTVTLVIDVGLGPTEKTFGAFLLTELRKNWGGSRFSIVNWKSDLGCDRYVEWEVEAEGQTRRVCRDPKAVDRIASLASTFQLLTQAR